jgi:hypothetical protein
MGLTEIETDVGLLEHSIKKKYYLKYRKYSQSFFFIETQEYNEGKEIFSGKIMLEEYIHVQRREYTKMAEVFSITGGYMQLISTVFALINLFTKNLSAEIKILNKLFNFNVKQRKIILSIQYEKQINYNAHLKNNSMNYSIPFKARKSLNPYQAIIHPKFNKRPQKDLIDKKNEHHENYTHKFNSQKNNNILAINQKTNIFRPRVSSSTKYNINNISNFLMIKDEDLDKSQIVKLYENNSKKDILPKKNIDFRRFESELVNRIDFNVFDYLCCNGKIRDKTASIELFNYGINFYRNQMNIINIFNIIFLTQVMINHQNTKNHFLDRVIEISISS